MDTQQIGKRIKQARSSLNLSRGDIARALHISEHAVGNWERGDANLSGKNLITLASLLNTSPEYILTGRNKTPPLQLREAQTPYAMNIRKVPLISDVQAGSWKEAVDNFSPGDAETWVETSARVSSQAFALRVTGDSMHNPHGSPSIPEGAVVIVDPNAEATSGKIVVAKLTDSQEVTIKRLVIDGPNRYLKPLNPDYKTILINGNCTIVGVAKKVEFDL